LSTTLLAHLSAVETCFCSS